MTTKSRSNAPDVTVLLVAEGEPFAEALATQLEALSVQVELLASADNITDAFIVPPQLVALAAAAAPDGGASVIAQLAKRAATSGVAVAVIGEAASGASAIDPSASPEDMAAQLAKLASERRGSRARIPLPSPGVERSVVERPRLPPTPRAPLPRAPVAPSSEARSSERSSEAKPPLAKPMPRPGGAKPFAKTLQLTAVRPPASAAASAFASRPPAPVASAAARPPAPPAPPRPAIATPSTPSSSTAPSSAASSSAVSSSAVSSSAVSSSAVSSSTGGASPSAPTATSPIPPSPMMPSLAATPTTASSTPQPTERTSAEPPVAPIAAAPAAAPPPAPGRARMRHATLVGLPSPVAVIARDAQPAAIARDAQPSASDAQPSSEGSKPDVATTLVGHPTPALDAAPDAHAPTPTDVALPTEPDDAPATVRPPAPADDALEATDMGIELPEHPSEPPIAGEATDAGIPLPDDLSTPPVETSDFAIAFEHQPVVHTPTGDVPAPTDLPGEPTPILKMAPYAPSAPSHEHPAAPPPRARSWWPLALAAVVLLGGSAAGAAWFWSQRPPEPIVTSVAPSDGVTVSPPPEVGAVAPTVPTAPAVVPSEIAPSEAAPSEAAPSEAAPSEIAPSEIAPSEAVSPAPAPAGGVRLPIGEGDPIEGTDAEFDLARLGVTPIIDPGGRRTTRRRIDRLLAQAYRARSRERLDDAEEAYREVLALDADNPRALVGLSLVSADRDDHASAVLYARRLVRLHPTAPANLVLLGDRYAAGGDVAAARRCYERALSIDRRHRGARAALSALP